MISSTAEKLLFLIFVYFLVSVCSQSSHDFYNILGVNKKSTPKEIRDAYLELIKKCCGIFEGVSIRRLDHGEDLSVYFNPDKERKEWLKEILLSSDNTHPSSNPSEEAIRHFHLINEAYKTLSDPEKKSLYEVFGKGVMDLDIFLKDENERKGGNFQIVTSSTPQLLSNNFYTISSRYFDEVVKPKSFQQPFIIFVTSLKCLDCKGKLDLWMDWCKELLLDGVRCGLIRSEDEKLLLRRLHVPNLPSGSGMVGILEGKTSWNVNISTSFDELKYFLITLFPKELITELSDQNFIDFLNTCTRSKNHISFVLFTTSFLPPLPYCTSLFNTRSHVSGGFVYMKNASSQHVIRKFNITSDKITILVFKEDFRTPVFKLSMKTFHKDHFDQIMNKHQLLNTPRLSCPVMFDLICPLETPKNKKSMCVILLTSSKREFEPHLASFKEFSESYAYSDRVRFGYVFEEKQKSFVQLLTWGKGIYNSTTNSLKVAVIWRRDGKSLNYEYLEGGWHVSGQNLQRARRRLVQLLDWLLKSPSTLGNVVELKNEIVNEHLKNLKIRIIIRLKEWIDGCFDFLLGVDNSTYLMGFKTIAFVIMLGFGFHYLAQKEVQRIEGSNISTKSNSTKQMKNSEPEKPIIYVHMLCPESYKSLVVDSPSNMRLLLLMVDSISKERLTKYFGTFLQSYARSKAFKFAFVDLDQYFNWYRQLLDITMRQSEHYRTLKKCFNNINVKNCLGTVLAINGVKKYYYMYHISSFKPFPSFHKKDGDSNSESEVENKESTDAASEELKIGMSQSSGSLKRRNNCRKKETDESCNNDEQNKENKKFVDADKLFEFDLLRGLDSWLEKLCQGKLKKFKISQWPRDMTSQFP